VGVTGVHEVVTGQRVEAAPRDRGGLFEDPESDEAAHRSRLLMFDVLKFIEHHRYRLVMVENVIDIATQPKYALAWQVWRHDLKEPRLQVPGRLAQLDARPGVRRRRPRSPGTGSTSPAGPRATRPPTSSGSCGPRLLPEVRRDHRVAAGVEERQDRRPLPPVLRLRPRRVRHHRRARLAPAAAAIDWSIPGERIGDRLKPKTRARIAAGIARYWGPIHIEETGNQYDAADPKHPQHGDPNAYYRAWSVDDVIRTLHTRESKALAIPVEGRDGKEARAARRADAHPDHPPRDRGRDPVHRRAPRRRLRRPVGRGPRGDVLRQRQPPRPGDAVLRVDDRRTRSTSRSAP
jgi:DNA (cytosine-5)-methyltransferase 1